MSYSIQSPYSFFSDRDGSPLQSGYLYFGVAGLPAETNPTTVYWDEALTIPVSQPVRTKNGFPYNNGTPALIWTAADVSLTVKNKKSVTVITSLTNSTAYSQIAAAEAAILTDLAVPGGSDLVGHKGTGANATTTTVGAKLRQMVNVKDYGAVGDGIANDTQAFQRAVNNANGPVYVPAGVYSITGVTLLPGTQLIGENRALSILRLRAPLAGNGMINGVFAEGIAVENMTIDGALLIGTKNALINWYGCTWGRVENCNFINTDKFAISFDSFNYGIVRGCSFIMPQHIGARIVRPLTSAGSGGPISQSGLVGVVSGGGTPTEVAQFTYSTDASGSVIESSINFSTNGQGYTSNPSISFPAVPNASAAGRYCGAQTVGITITRSAFVPSGHEVSFNYFESAHNDFSVYGSNFFNNVSRYLIYGGAFVSEIAEGVGKNNFYNNYIEAMGLCKIPGPFYNTYIGTDENDTASIGYEIWGLYERIYNCVIRDCASGGIDFGSQGGECFDNIVYDNNRYWKALNPLTYEQAGIVLRSGNPTYNANYSTIRNNRCFDQSGAAGTQGFGIQFETGALVGVHLIDNDCGSNPLGPYNLRGATLASFRGQRLQAVSTVDPASIASGGALDITVSIPNLKATGLDPLRPYAYNWIYSCSFDAVGTLPVMTTVRYASTGNATIRLFNFSASAYDIPSGKIMIQAEETVA